MRWSRTRTLPPPPRPSSPEAGAKRLEEAESALAAFDNDVLGALDDSQREVVYNLLLQAARGGDVRCPLD
jgi:hypothetical protein